MCVCERVRAYLVCFKESVACTLDFAPGRSNVKDFNNRRHRHNDSKMILERSDERFDCCSVPRTLASVPASASVRAIPVVQYW